MPLPLILLPGMMCDERLFAAQVAALSADRETSVLMFRARDQTMTDIASDLLSKCPPKFLLGGLSMGGIVAMEMMRQAPDRIGGVVLMDTNPLAEVDAVKAGRTPQMEKAMNGQLASVMRDEMKPRYLADPENSGKILDLCMDMAIGLGPEVFVSQSMALRDRPDQSDTLRGFSTPALVLCGRTDTLCPLHRHELMHDLLPNSSLEIIEGAGHLPTLEQPEKTTAAIARWSEGL